MKRNLVTSLAYARKKVRLKISKKILTKLILLGGPDIPSSVKIGENVSFCHNCLGSVIYDSTVLEDNVVIFQNVTIGRADPFSVAPVSIEIKEGAVLCAGAKILGRDHMVVGANTMVASNAVLLCSTGDNEIWGGVPARLLKRNT